MTARFDLHAMRACKLAELPALRERLRRLPARVRRVHRFPAAGDGVNIIAEIKKASPSAGRIREVDASYQAEVYRRGGASALSVLTDGAFFGGSYADLEAVCAATDLPVLCKEFVYFPDQVDCAYRCGADMVLLIARALGDDELRGLYARIVVTGMLPLVEIHHAGEMGRVLALGIAALMVNTRNLETLEMDRAAAAHVLEMVPPGIETICASGIDSRGDIEFFFGKGARTFLVGSALMKSDDPELKIKELRDVR